MMITFMDMNCINTSGYAPRGIVINLFWTCMKLTVRFCG